MKMVERTRSLLKDAILIDPGWALQDPMKHPGSPKLRSGKSVPTPFLCGVSRLPLIERAFSARALTGKTSRKLTAQLQA